MEAKKMAFGIIRARNLNLDDLSSTDKHNARRYDSKEEFPENISPEGKRYERYFDTTGRSLLKNQTCLKDVIYDRLDKQGVVGIKSNSNLAIEYVATINDKKAWDHYSPEVFFSETSRWLENRHGKGSLVATYVHFDESNPHAHFVVVPVTEKVVKWKNTRGSGERREKRLNTREFTGGREKLRKLQDDFFSHLKKYYRDELGVPIYRGTLAEHQTKKYIQQTVAEIGRIRDKASRMDDEVAKVEALLEMRVKLAEIAQKELELKNMENGKFKAGRNWANKGTRDNPSSEIFHGKSENKESGETKKRGFRR